MQGLFRAVRKMRQAAVMPTPVLAAMAGLTPALTAGLTAASTATEAGASTMTAMRWARVVTPPDRLPQAWLEDARKLLAGMHSLHLNAIHTCQI